jgi:hypothetical protein
MHSEGVRACGAIFVPALACAVVAGPAHASAVNTTAVVTGNTVTCTSGTII